MHTKSALMTPIGAVVAMTIALLAATTTGAQAAPTCRGQEATHVGEPGEDLRATSGDDVIVTNGSVSLHALAGDDVICVTGDRRRTWVYAEAGDDEVAAGRVSGGEVIAVLGSGSDTYAGHAGRDAVNLDRGRRSDADRVSTGPGRDVLYGNRYRGRLTGSLGQGGDYLDAALSPERFVVDGGPGRDRLNARAQDRLLVRLDDGRLVVDGERAGTLHHFEQALAWSHRVVVHGNRQPNFVRVSACYADVYARGGADHITPEIFYDECSAPTPRMRFHGGTGDDRLQGWVGPDRLIGGSGDDVALGGDGSDVCRAEVRRGCEA